MGPQLHEQLESNKLFLGVALAVKQDRTAPLTFLIPSLLGTTILFISWFWRCIRDKSCYPGTKYLTLYCLPGLIIGGAGLACLMLESSPSISRYQHSVWQVARGVAVMLLLPESTRDEGQFILHIGGKYSIINLIMFQEGKRKSGHKSHH